MKPYLFSTSSHPDAINVSSLNISFFHPFIDFPQYDSIILTSKQAVKALSKYNHDEYKEIPALCISKITAQSFKEIGGKVLEIGAGYGDTLSEIISLYPKDKRWLYLRAREVASDFVVKVKEDSYCIDEVILYESKCSVNIAKIKIEENAKLIFTSPSSVRCFLKYHTFKVSQKIVVIGKTTAKALPQNINPTVSPEPSIDSCLKTINSL